MLLEVNKNKKKTKKKNNKKKKKQQKTKKQNKKNTNIETRFRNCEILKIRLIIYRPMHIPVFTIYWGRGTWGYLLHRFVNIIGRNVNTHEECIKECPRSPQSQNIAYECTKRKSKQTRQTVYTPQTGFNTFSLAD